MYPPIEQLDAGTSLIDKPEASGQGARGIDPAPIEEFMIDMARTPIKIKLIRDPSAIEGDAPESFIKTETNACPKIIEHALYKITPSEFMTSISKNSTELQIIPETLPSPAMAVDTVSSKRKRNLEPETDPVTAALTGGPLRSFNAIRYDAIANASELSGLFRRKSVLKLHKNTPKSAHSTLENFMLWNLRFENHDVGRLINTLHDVGPLSRWLICVLPNRGVSDIRAKVLRMSCNLMDPLNESLEKYQHTPRKFYDLLCAFGMAYAPQATGPSFPFALNCKGNMEKAQIDTIIPAEYSDEVAKKVKSAGLSEPEILDNLKTSGYGLMPGSSAVSPADSVEAIFNYFGIPCKVSSEEGKPSILDFPAFIRRLTYLVIKTGVYESPLLHFFRNLGNIAEQVIMLLDNVSDQTTHVLASPTKRSRTN